MRVLEGVEVDLHAGGDVRGLERLELEGHLFFVFLSGLSGDVYFCSFFKE